MKSSQCISRLIPSDEHSTARCRLVRTVFRGLWVSLGHPRPSDHSSNNPHIQDNFMRTRYRNSPQIQFALSAISIFC